MTTGRINQVSAYHRWLTEAQVKHQQLSVTEGIHTKGSDRTNQAPVTETSAPTRGSPLHRDRERQTETDIDRQRQTETDRDRQRQTETDRDRQRQTETDARRQRQKDTYRHTHADTDPM